MRVKEEMEKKIVARLPLDLAETKQNDNANLSKRLVAVLVKIIIIMLCISFFFGVYFWMLWWITSDADNLQNDNIIVVTKFQKPSNVTFIPENFEIVLRLRNNTSGGRFVRKKRHIYNQSLEIKDDNNKRKCTKDQTEKIKKIISERNVLCNEESHKDRCKDLMEKLKLITNNNLDYLETGTRAKKSEKLAKFLNSNHRSDRSPSKIFEPIPLSRSFELSSPTSLPTDRHGYHHPIHNYIIPADSGPYHNQGTAQQLTDTCLLAKLMKQSFPHLHGVYDKPKFESEYSQMYTRHTSHNLITPLNQNHDISNESVQQQHPQDVEIAKLITANQVVASEETTGNTTVRETLCQAGKFACDNGEGCIDENLLCDGNVDCSDVSDEIQCSCKDRVDRSRICDGYFDCPLGEDEMGCNGCNEIEFSCQNGDTNSKGTCFTKEQRCNNKAECSNHKDELDCIMLAPKLHMKPLFAVSQTEGYLQRNFKGHWYSVCSNPYMWAHDACHRETGLIIRPPYIEIVKIDPTLKVDYINMVPGGLMEITDTCLNSSAVYVTCPGLLCGTRMQTISQITRENMVAENNIFGRNKRFLLQGLSYPNIFYVKREKRYAEKNLEMNDSMNHLAESDDARDKRAETRVVGGKPSQPAAWPWMVALHRDGVFHCGGVIINQNWIISAAHCVHKFWRHYYEVRVGTLRRLSFSPQEQNHRVSHIIVNQKYSREDMKNDISMLHVSPGIQFSRWVRPICLPSPEVAGSGWLSGPQPGTICTAVGWGATVERGPDPDHLREVEVPIWNHCNHREDLAGNEICAGFVDGGKDACQGDSGGPLLCKNPINDQQWYIAGIVSHGDGCGRKGEPGVYTRVSLFVSWIRHHISSKTLPVIQPKQECPGFRCDSGISKCLPKKRMCDEIIDCLDGEDEMNCEFKRPEIFRNVNLHTLDNVTDKKVNVSEIEILDIVKNESARESSNETDSIEKVDDIPKFKENLKNYPNIHDEQSSKNLEDHSQNTSILEIMNSEKSSESTETSTENFTSDPTQITSNEEIENYSVIRESTTDWLTSENDLAYDLNINTSEMSIPDQQSQLHKLQNDVKIDENLPLIPKHSLKTNFSTKSNLNNTQSHNVSSLEGSRNFSNLVSNTTNNENVQRGDTIPDKETENFEITNSVTSQSNESEITALIVPAKARKQYLFPSEFECARIQQSIPYQNRCDRRADCEDGTDELGCTCTDYLSTFESNLLCDGNIDCSGGQDEIDCFECEDKQFLCKRDYLCITSKYVCDGQRQCPSGDDELDCLTLSNGKEVYDFNDKPEINLEGYITKKHGHNWHIVCKETMSIELQEEAANYVCRYMGFSSANRYLLKYINVKETELLDMESNRRYKRHINNSTPVYFTYEDNVPIKNARNVILKDPEIIKESCVPNITKTCMTLYVYCEHSLYTEFDVPEIPTIGKAAEDPREISWPWIAKLYVDGNYKCTGVLVDLSWALVSHSCLQKTIPTHHYITIVLGSHRTLENIQGPYEQIHKVDVKKEFYRSKVTLLHLKDPAKYSVMIKPMVVFSPPSEDKDIPCIAVGQNKFNTTFTIFLKEERRDCEINHRCFTYETNLNICEQESSEDIGIIISCHSKNGWYPAASYIKKDMCNFKRIIAVEIEHLKHEIKHVKDIALSNLQELDQSDDCLGIRCPRGRCIELHDVCNGIPNCEDGGDEFKNACKLKNEICTDNPFHKGCECPSGELKCRNGRCIAKELFKNGHDDCGDDTDEPTSFRCSDYLSRVMPSRLCDGILHCHDRSDEDPTFCKCFAKKGFDCRGGFNNENYCVAMDMVCDGIRDCPNGEDERQCLALHAPTGSPTGIGEVVIRSHGVWFSKCYPTQNHTKSELEDICRQLGFLSGHSKQLTALENMMPHPHNSIILDDFSNITFNNKTSIKLRNSHLPRAKAVADTMQNCYPVFLECL